MRIIVFGASGACGSLLVQFALERGHHVTVVARTSSDYSPPAGASLLTGDVTDVHFVQSAAPGYDTVFSCLGLRRASIFPWARLLSPPDLVETFTHHLIGALAGDPVLRIIWISAGGVGDSRKQCTAPIRAMIRSGNVGLAYDDLARAEARIPTDDHRWLAVRPVTLMNGAPTGAVGPVSRYGLFSIARRADVATWMLDTAEGRQTQSGSAVLLGTVWRHPDRNPSQTGIKGFPH